MMATVSWPMLMVRTPRNSFSRMVGKLIVVSVASMATGKETAVLPLTKAERKNAIKAMTSRIVGKEYMISTTRMRKLSTRPPMKPEVNPKATPQMRLTVDPIIAAASEIRAPYINRESKSRPR